MANPESASIVSLSKVHARGDVLPGNRAVSYKKILLVENSRSDGLTLRDEPSKTTATEPYWNAYAKSRSAMDSSPVPLPPLTPTAAPAADQLTTHSSFLALPSVIPGSIECPEASLHYVTALCRKKSPRLCDHLPEQLHTVGGS